VREQLLVKGRIYTDPWGMRGSITTKKPSRPNSGTERLRSRGRCVGNGRCRGSPSRAWNGILHFVYFSQFSSRLIGCPQPPFTTFTARSGPTQDRYLCGNGQWPVATDVLHFLRSYFLSGTGGLLSITLPLAVAFVRNSDFICAFRAADRVLILLILICY
jgi:hypothetical protein